MKIKMQFFPCLDFNRLLAVSLSHDSTYLCWTSGNAPHQNVQNFWILSGEGGQIPYIVRYFIHVKTYNMVNSGGSQTFFVHKALDK